MFLLSEHTRKSIGDLRTSFLNARPFRHVVIENFFDAEFCQQILDDFPRFEERFALNEMGQVGRKAARTDVRDISASFNQLDRFLQTPQFLNFAIEVTGIPDLHYDPDYLGGGTHENRHEQSLSPHVDFNIHPKMKEHRRINLIVYLNHEWNPAWGGGLTLHDDPWRDEEIGKVTIAPIFNRAVIFETSERSWHGFDEIIFPASEEYLSRKSFAIYLYSKDRPSEETAPEHATVYIPKAMPKGWSAGKVLSEQDISLLNGRFTALRGHLRFLYDREKAFSRALQEARSSFRLPIQGYLLQSEAPVGIWSDLWAGQDFSASFTPERAAKGLEIDLFAPKELSDEQTLSIEVLGRSWTYVAERSRRSTFVVDLTMAAGATINIAIRAAYSFIPAQLGNSTDQRALAWLLIAIRLKH